MNHKATHPFLPKTATKNPLQLRHKLNRHHNFANHSHFIVFPLELSGTYQVTYRQPGVP